MDALLVLNKTADQERVREQTPFIYASKYNDIEFKGRSDPLTREGYNLIRARSYLYLGLEGVSAGEMTVTIISARQPRKVLYHCPEDVKWEKLGPGYYRSLDLFPVHLLVCNELELVPANYPLLLFAASDKKFEEVVKQLLAAEDSVYVSFAL